MITFVKYSRLPLSKDMLPGFCFYNCDVRNLKISAILIIHK